MIKLAKSKTYWISTAIYVVLAIVSFSFCGSIHGRAPFGGSSLCIPFDVFYAPIYYAIGLPAILGEGLYQAWFVPIAIASITIAILLSGFVTHYLIRGAYYLKSLFDEMVRVKPKP